MPRAGPQLLLISVSSALLLLLNSCKRVGCTDPDATNYDSKATHEDGTCIYSEPAGAISLTIGRDCASEGGLDFSAAKVECPGCSTDTFAISSDIYFSETKIGIVAGDTCWGKDSLGIVSVGDICCLGEIDEVPASGFVMDVPPAVSHGYVIRTREGKYARLYIDEFIYDSFGEVVGAKLRVQYPFGP